MDNSVSNATKLPWSWPVITLLIGSAMGIVWRSDASVTATEPLIWMGIFLTASICTGLVSLVADRLGKRTQTVAVLLALAILLVLWLKWSEPQRGLHLILTLSSVLLFSATLVHFSALAVVRWPSRVAAACAGYAAIIAAAELIGMLPAWLPTSRIAVIDRSIAIIFVGALVLQLLVAPQRRVDDSADTENDPFLPIGWKALVPGVRAARAHVLLLVHISLVFFSFSIFWSGSDIAPFEIWTNAWGSPVFLGAAFLLGALSACSLLRQMGIKRALTFAMLTWIAVMVGMGFAAAQPQNEFLIAIVVFFSGVVSASIISVAAAAAPPNDATAYSAWCGLAAAIGALLALKVAGTARADMVILIAALSHFLALIVVQLVRVTAFSIHSKDALDAFEPDVIQRTGEWPESAQRGLSRHTLSSRISRALSRICIEVFFGKVRVEGLQHVTASQGAILVANHPNTFLDAVLLTAIFPARLHYLAKAPLWRFPILGSVLDRLGAIAVTRRQDAGDPTAHTNQRAFDTATKTLKGSGHVLVFPEGVSQPGLSLKPIKTGTARLAFQFARQTHWNRPVKVIPIGLDYAEPTVFRSAVTVRIGEPMDVSAFQAAYRENPKQAVWTVTQSISDRLKELIPHLDHPELEHLVHMIHQLYGENVGAVLGVSDTTQARLAIARAVDQYQNLDPDTVRLFYQRIASYFDHANRLATPANHPPIPKRQILEGFRTIFSPATLGLMVNWLPYKLTGAILERATPAAVWIATGKLTIGCAVFAAYYSLVGLIGTVFFSPLVAYFAILIFAFSGVLALGSLDRFAFRTHQLKTVWKAFWTQNTDRELDEMRIGLIADLERFRERHAFYGQAGEDQGGTS